MIDLLTALVLTVAFLTILVIARIVCTWWQDPRYWRGEEE